MTRAVLAILGTVAGLVLLLSFKSHSPTSTAAPVVGVPSSGAPAVSGGPAAGSPVAIGPGDRTITGTVAQTRFGPVQVQITVGGGRLTKVTVLRSPTASSADVQIGQYALPQLDREALAAQSASIHAVSGATYTSDGYITSLQSALDKARG